MQNLPKIDLSFLANRKFVYPILSFLAALLAQLLVNEAEVADYIPQIEELLWGTWALLVPVIVGGDVVFDWKGVDAKRPQQ